MRSKRFHQATTEPTVDCDRSHQTRWNRAVGGLVAPDAPTLDSVTPGDAQNVIAYTPPAGSPDSYNIYWATSSPVTKSSNKLTGVTNPYTHTGRTNGTTYYYAVTAVKGGLESALSNEASGTPLLTCLLDAVAGTEIVGVSTSRRLKSAYTGALRRLIRSTDSTERDGTQTALRWLDSDDLESWLGAANAIEVKLYDQTGNGRDLSYGDTAYLRKAATAGVLVAGPNSRWANDFGTNGGVLDSAAQIIPASAWWFYALVINDSHPATYRGFWGLLDSATVDMTAWYSDTYRVYSQVGGSQVVNNSVNYGNWMTVIGVINGASSKLIVNGNEVTGTLGASTLSKLRICDIQDGAHGWCGRLSEFCAWSGTPSAGQITAVQNNVTAAFGV